MAKDKRYKGLNLGRFAINETQMREAMHQAIKDMVMEAKLNNENNQDEMYVCKYHCLLNPKTFIKRFGLED